MKKVRIIVVTASVFAILLGGSVIEATAQNGPVPIIGCIKPGTGLLRIPPSSEGCKDQERPLTFGDLPLLVALQNQVNDLENRVADLEACVPPPNECNEYSSR